MLNHSDFIIPIALSTLVVLASPLATAQEQRLPATQHQSEASDSIKKKTAAGAADPEARLPSSAHQKEVLRQFEEADTDGDGSLNMDEYAAYMEHRAARAYWNNMQAPEKLGTETVGPRDRTAADADKKPVLQNEPAVDE